MGSFKPLLELGDGQTVLERLINLFLTTEITDITVVTGHMASALSPLLRRYPVKERYNPAYTEGMFASMLQGIAGLEPMVEGVFMLPVDIPLVRAGTLTHLIEAFQTSEKSIVYPVFHGQRGHPPLIEKARLLDVLDWTGQGGLRTFLWQRESLALEVPVPDEGILRDMDTPLEYEWVRKRHVDLDLPTEQECLFLQSRYETAPEIKKHCRLVADTALGLGQALHRRGHSLNLELVFAAGMLHDLVRHLPEHAATGARILSGFGFHRVAEIVRTHVDLEVGPRDRITEAELVYLADKLVRGQERVSLETRFLEKEKQFKETPAAVAAIRERYARARKARQRVEDALGMSLEETGPSP